MKEGSAAHKRQQELVAAARIYKAEGHTHAEVGQMFGKSEAWSMMWCKGISPQYKDPPHKANQYTSGKFDRIANVRRVLAERAPNFEYVRGFKDMDSKIVVRCRVCGCEVEKSMTGLRAWHDSKCPNCEKLRKESTKAQGRMRYASLLFNSGKQQSWKFCGCGVLIASNQKQCKECTRRRASRYMNVKKEKRRKAAFTKESAQISIQTLYKRDSGVCWICGEPCRLDVDYNDNMYPSIDHVLPISKGGKDEWGNVKLAHRLCNSIRGDRV